MFSTYPFMALFGEKHVSTSPKLVGPRSSPRLGALSSCPSSGISPSPRSQLWFSRCPVYSLKGLQ